MKRRGFFGALFAAPAAVKALSVAAKEPIAEIAPEPSKDALAAMPMNAWVAQNHEGQWFTCSTITQVAINSNEPARLYWKT